MTLLKYFRISDIFNQNLEIPDFPFLTQPFAHSHFSISICHLPIPISQFPPTLVFTTDIKPQHLLCHTISSSAIRHLFLHHRLTISSYIVDSPSLPPSTTHRLFCHLQSICLCAAVAVTA